MLEKSASNDAGIVFVRIYLQIVCMVVLRVCFTTVVRSIFFTVAGTKINFVPF